MSLPPVAVAPESILSTSVRKPRTSNGVPVAVFDHLPKLVEAVRWGARGRYDEIVQSMANAVEESRPGLAAKLRSIVDNTLTPLNAHSKGADLVKMKEAVRSLETVILPADLATEVECFIHETKQRDALKKYGLSPRHKVLIAGPSGSGKTLLAEAVANALAVPLLNVRYGLLVDSHLGETSKNIEHLIEYASRGPCVLFFDEFDGLAVKRSEGRDITEMRRVTNHLLIHLETLPSTTTLIAATNELCLIDDAIVRRFDTQWDTKQATRELKLKCIERELSVDLTAGKDMSDFFDRIANLPHTKFSEVVNFCVGLRRDLALHGGEHCDALIETANHKAHPVQSVP